MKSLIWKNIIVFMLIPFICLYITLSLYIVICVYRDKETDLDKYLDIVAERNTSDISNFFYNMELLIQHASASLESIDRNDSFARLRAEGIITELFTNNPEVINAWVVYEPNAFDGRDSFHTDDYPNIPSGRFMRIYNHDGNGISLNTSFEETMLYNLLRSYWYIIPRDTGKLFTDIAEGYNSLWDYKANKETANRVTIASPIFDAGKVAGVVGVDVQITTLIVHEEEHKDEASALLFSNGAIAYSTDIFLIGRNIEELNFPDAQEIFDALNKGESLYIPRKYSGILGTDAYAFIEPLRVAGSGRPIFIYTAINESEISSSTRYIVTTVACSFGLVFLVFGALILYLARKITQPINNLTQATEAISNGMLETYIAPPKTNDEVGQMTRSLLRIVEQLNASIEIQKRYQDQIAVYTSLNNALYRTDSLEDVFNEAVTVISHFFSLYEAFLVFIRGGSPRVAALWRREGVPAESRIKAGDEFSYNSKVVGLIEGKQYLSTNNAANRTMKLPFADPETSAVCILPIREKSVLRGYIVMKGSDKSGVIISDDSLITFIAETLTYLLVHKEALDTLSETLKTQISISVNQESYTVPEAKTEEFAPVELSLMDKLKAIEGLDADKGLSLLGSDIDQYQEMLRVICKVIRENSGGMDDYLANDLPRFAVEIHGMKGALYNAGADWYGDKAKDLEFAAKANDGAFCNENWPPLKKKLAEFADALSDTLPGRKRDDTAAPGDTAALLAAIDKALSGVKRFSTTDAEEALAPFRDLTWESPAPPETGEFIEAIFELLENIEYKEAEAKLLELKQMYPGAVG
jgi:HAMP domain-containing protein